jgi:hypothetical protein
MPAAAANSTQILGGGLWGLDRLDQVVRQPDDGEFRYHDSVSGNGVTIFVLDEGTFDGADDLTGRVDPALGFGGGLNASIGLDSACVNSGDAVSLASLAAGTTHGVAKDARVRFLQISDCEYRERERCENRWVDDDHDPATPDVWKRVCWRELYSVWSVGKEDLIEAIDYVTNTSQRPAIGLIKQTWVTRWTDLDQALTRSVKRGVTWVLAAGDDTPYPACDHTPSWLGSADDGVITVGAVDVNDAFVPGTAWGPCVDIFAPGLDVAAPAPVEEATAAAAAYTAGVIAQYLEPGPDWDPGRLERWLKSQATVGALSGLPAGSPNLLLHSAWWGPVLRLLCENTSTTSTRGRFSCEVSDLNGASSGYQWYKDGQHRAVWDGLTEVTGSCTIGAAHTFQVEATRSGHRAVARFGGFTCQVAQ